MQARKMRRVMTLCRCPFLQNVKISNNHFEKTQALKMSIQTLQVPATFFLMTLAHCRFPFLQKLQLFNNHFLKTPALKITILELQVPATFFLTTSALKINILELQVLATTILRMCSHCGMSFLQNNQLFNNRQKLQVPTTSAHCKLLFLQNTQLQRQRS